MPLTTWLQNAIISHSCGTLPVHLDSSARPDETAFEFDMVHRTSQFFVFDLAERMWHPVCTYTAAFASDTSLPLTLRDRPKQQPASAQARVLRPRRKEPPLGGAASVRNDFVLNHPPIIDKSFQQCSHHLPSVGKSRSAPLCIRCAHVGCAGKAPTQ